MKNHQSLSEGLYFLNHDFEKDLATFFMGSLSLKTERDDGRLYKI
jgi:hypothetical protein